MKTTLTLTPELEKHFSKSSDCFEQIMAKTGEVYRELEGRRTQRVFLGENAYFIKQHFGVGWKEIFKNLLQLRLPVLSAKNEWLALSCLQKLSVCIPEVIGYGRRGVNPAKMQSFLITRELPKNISLEDFCKHWRQCAPSFTVKQRLIKEIARIARTLHVNGINHRDFYICHFLLDIEELLKSQVKLYLIDLHRAEVRYRTPKRWVIKDLAGLYFSSKDIGLTKRDLLRFILEYRNKSSLKDILDKESTFWFKVKKRGETLYRKHEQ